MSSFLKFEIEINTTTRPLLYYLRGLEKLNNCLTRKGRITPDMITIDVLQIVLKRGISYMNIPISHFKYITFAQEGNSIHVIIDIMPFTIITIILCLNSEQVARKIQIKYHDSMFSLCYLKLETSIRKTDPETVKKRYSWWNS